MELNQFIENIVRPGFMRGNYKSTQLKIKNKGIEKYKQYYPSEYLWILYYSAAMHLYSGELKNSKETINLCLDFIKTLETNGQKFSDKDIFHTLRGEYYLELGLFTLAKKHYEIGDSILQNSIDKKDRRKSIRIAINKTNIGFSHSNILDTLKDNDFKECINLHNESLTTLNSIEKRYPYLEKEITRLKFHVLLYKAFAYIRYSDYKNERTLLDSALVLIENADNLEESKGRRRNVMIYHNKGIIFFKLAKYDTKYLVDAKEIINQFANYYSEDIKVYATQAIGLLELAVKSSSDETLKNLIPYFVYFNKSKKQAYELFTSEINALEEEAEKKKKSIEAIKIQHKKSKESFKKTKNNLDEIQKDYLAVIIPVIFFLIIAIISSIGYRKTSKINIKQNKELNEKKDQLVQEQNFISILHKNTNKLSKRVSEESNVNAFMASTINDTFQFIKSYLNEIDVFLIGIYNHEREGLDLFVKEVGKNSVTPDEPIFFGLEEENRLAVLCYNKQELILESDYLNNYTKYFKELLPGKRGEHYSSIIYQPLEQGMGIISVQTKESNIYNIDHARILKTVGNNVAIAYGNVKSVGRIKSLRREISHRLKNHLGALAITIEKQLLDKDVKNNHDIVKALNETKSRVNAIQLVHNHLDQKGQGIKKYLPSQDYFEDLISNLFEKSFGYNLLDQQTEILIKLQNVKPLHFEFVQDLGLVITEIGLNIFEHAYKNLPKEKHWVRFEAKINDQNELEFCLSDRGKGLSQKKFELSKRFGFQLIQTTIRDRYKGKIIIGPFKRENKKSIGTKFIIQIPISKKLLL